MQGFHHHVKVLARQSTGMHEPAGYLTGLRQRLEETLAVIIIKKNVLATVPTAHDAINRAGIFNTNPSRHGLDSNTSGRSGHPKNEPC